MPKRYSYRKVVKVLKKCGFVLISQVGSHQKFNDGEKTVIVPVKKTVYQPGTFKSILRQSGLELSNFENKK